MAMMYYYVVSDGDVDPTASGLVSCEQTIADVLKENEGEAGIAYIGHDTIGGVGSFYVQWAKTGSKDVIIGQYSAPIQWKVAKNPGTVKWGTYYNK
ncbi:MAG: hypothetical protein K6C68_09475 [Ruminococcus sp.]|nr:hypothetical protein [Ruminococcus sp.]